MRAISLQSGSNGNCYYVEAQGVRILIDAGISGVQTEKRLAVHGIDIRAIDAVLISHDHADHIRSAGILGRKYGLPIWVTSKTLLAAMAKGGPGRIPRLVNFTSGDVFAVNGLRVETVPTPHDGVDGVGFVVDDGHRRLGILTDLGCVFSGLQKIVNSLDGVFLESNYDKSMLENGPYPYYLKKRIAGEGGHISNMESAGLLDGAFKKQLQWACLAHLSKDNNTPETALGVHRSVLGNEKCVTVADRYTVSKLFELE